MKSLQQKRSVKAIAFLSGLALLIFFLILLFKNEILNYVLQKLKNKVKVEYKVILKTGKSEITGLNRIHLSDVLIIPEGNDTFLTVHSIDAYVKIRSLLIGRIEFNELFTERVVVNAKKTGRGANYSFFLKDRSGPLTGVTVEKTDYGHLFNKLSNVFFSKIPDDVQMKNTDINYSDENEFIRMNIPDLTLKDGQGKLSMNVNHNGRKQQWVLQGKLHTTNHQSTIKVFSEKGQLILPLVTGFKTKVSFDTLEFKYKHKSGAGFNADLNMKISGLKVINLRLAPNEVSFNNISLNSTLKAEDQTVSLDKNSAITINNIKSTLYFSFTRDDSKKNNFRLHISLA